MTSYIPLFLEGMTTTFFSWIIAGIMSLFIGVSLGIISCNQLASPLAKRILFTFSFVAKGIPAYVQILIAYFILPSFLGLQIEAMTAACLALAFCSSGYVTEIVRSGINAIPEGQWDAARSLGYPLNSTIRQIILPQTFKNIGPALFGEFEQLLKSTSLLATIGITELTRSGMNIISRELNPVPVYLTVACLYLLFSFLLNTTSVLVERRLAYDKG